MARLIGIRVYPIKSCGGIDLQTAVVDAYGIQHDRQWVLVGGHNSKAMTQREYPYMARITVRLEEERMIVDAPRKDGRSLTLLLRSSSTTGGDQRTLQLWGDEYQGIDEGDVAAQWFQDALCIEESCRLLRITPTHSRLSPSGIKGPSSVGFADAFPFLGISEASLQDLNSRIPEEQKIDMRAFRPNLIFSDCEPYAEEEIGRFLIGTVEFEGVRPCVRCVIPSLDPTTGKRTGVDPNRTLLQYHTMLVEGRPKPIFGMNFNHQNQGQISVGDEIVLL